MSTNTPNSNRKKKIPYPLCAAMEANLAKSRLTENSTKQPYPLTHRLTILRKASSTPQ